MEVAASLGKLRHRLVDILHKPRELALRLVFSEAKGAQNVDVDVIEFVFPADRGNTTSTSNVRSLVAWRTAVPVRASLATRTRA